MRSHDVEWPNYFAPCIQEDTMETPEQLDNMSHDARVDQCVNCGWVGNPADIGDVNCAMCAFGDIE